MTEPLYQPERKTSSGVKGKCSPSKQAQLSTQDLLLGTGFSNFLLPLLIPAVLELSSQYSQDTEPQNSRSHFSVLKAVYPL